ncbi:hypothetical protein D8674_011031 [Pyrus ussuriensis x Pyrus communis]|uniref:Uncharacterized protein n=1 Tax=Pyrus ussuriensis x Pyrus communis TaxID=2448454 RepID=A0A5N5FXQ7_9ROSA|nr:hypothetical protein D8674_011031 [Pyrus ussuriensis x Pyrus communis]
MVVGKVDPTTLWDKLAAKTKKKVDLISPQLKKDNKDDSDDAKKKSSEKSNDNKKTKEGCIQNIHRIVTKTKGEGLPVKVLVENLNTYSMLLLVQRCATRSCCRYLFVA